MAGPMRGQPNCNYDTFEAVSEALEKEGYIAQSPHRNFGGDQSRSFEEYMLTDLRQLLSSDVICLLPGWEDSEGASMEARVAQATGKRFLAARPHDGGWSFEEFRLTDKERVEQRARRLVYGDRNRDYGDPKEDFTVIGRIWAAILSAHLGRPVPDIPPAIVAVMMSGLKLGRQGSSPAHLDSRVDVIGYQLCLDRIVTR